MIDTHCHLYPEYDFVKLTPKEIVERCLQQGIKEMWLASTEKADILWNLEFCKTYPKNLKTWVGWHPEQYLSYDDVFLSKLLEEYLTSKFPNHKSQNKSHIPNSKFQITNKDKVSKTYNSKLITLNCPIVGIGEIGLDFAAHPTNTKAEQIKVFESQLKLAKKHNLPVAIHCRDAIKETMEVMKKYPGLTYLWHCFNLNVEDTKILFNNFTNVYIGLNAIFTYKSGLYIKESLKIVPTTKILLETDSPFLAPRPFKYGFNTPEGVVSVYKALSEFLDLNLSELTEIIDKNAFSITQGLKIKD